MNEIDRDAVLRALNYPDFYWLAEQFSVSIPTAESRWEGYGTAEPLSAQYTPLSPSQAASFRQALKAWDDLIDPDFTEVSDPHVGQVRVAFTDMAIVYGSTNVWGYAYLPGYRGSPSAAAGDLWISAQLASASFKPGSFNYYALLHELGHALGLRHPFEGATALPRELTTLRHSVLSYQLPKDATVWTFTLGETGKFLASPSLVYPTTPMLLDALAIAAKYGSDTATATGDDVYHWSEMEPLLQTLVDAGGHDVVDLSDHIRGAIINLEPGTYSSIALYPAAEQKRDWSKLLPEAASLIAETFARGDAYEWRDNLAIAFDTLIEDVIAGSGNDTVQGNGTDNHLQGGSGNDRLYGGAGRDQLAGGPGDDILQGDLGDDVLDGGTGVDEARFLGPRSDILLLSAANGEIVISFQSGEADIARQIELLRFNDALLLLVYEEVAGPLVHGLYRMAFARHPDEAGFFYWQDQAREANLSAGDLVDIFAASPEFAARSLSDDHSNFIDGLYRNGLGRDPDMEGKLFWQSHLDAGALNRAEVLESFLISSEFQQFRAAQYDHGLWLAL